MKECDILWESKHTLAPLTYFQGGGSQDPLNPHDLRPSRQLRQGQAQQVHVHSLARPTP